jgi:hypothetical protein
MAGFGWHGMGGTAWGNHPGCPGDLRLAQRPTILQLAGGIVVSPTPAPGPTVTHPIVGVYNSPHGGYYIVETDGGVQNFGGAPFYGSLGNIQLTKPITGFSVTPSGNGYTMVGADGGVFNFGDSKYEGRVVYNA